MARQHVLLSLTYLRSGHHPTHTIHLEVSLRSRGATLLHRIFSDNDRTSRSPKMPLFISNPRDPTPHPHPHYATLRYPDPGGKAWCRGAAWLCAFSTISILDCTASHLPSFWAVTLRSTVKVWRPNACGDDAEKSLLTCRG
ncbi:hypothetical protein FA13DRAFT_398288 [Coprinellus micaceus]|uniref:Uncharacterized protein n=1 Tax=Coprinellus micaceus TaxID=71717 RepID=A0A4Y7TX49_COPMI|nr:hypothetical protein FA13DRAFT_398288 [Coprinellus micaceus]